MPRTICPVVIPTIIVALLSQIAFAQRSSDEKPLDKNFAQQDSDASLKHSTIRKGLVAVRLRERGAHLMEDFSRDAVDTKQWRIWHSNPDQVSFAIRDGQFTIRARNQIGHNGLWQLGPRRFKDVALVARMGIRSTLPGTHDLCLHLCGGDMPRSPDHWAEITMRDVGDGKLEFRPAVATELGGFVQSGRKLILKREDDRGVTGRVSLDGSSNLCSLEIRDADGHWHQVIDPTPLLLAHHALRDRRCAAGPRRTTTQITPASAGLMTCASIREPRRIRYSSD